MIYKQGLLLLNLDGNFGKLLQYELGVAVSMPQKLHFFDCKGIEQQTF
jgi:hypothetical protein